MGKLFLSVIAATAAITAVALPGVGFADEPVRVVIKFVKSAPRTGPTVAFIAESCPACVLRQDPAFARDNVTETLVDLMVPRRRTLELAFKVRPGAVRRVILEGEDARFAVEGDRLRVSLPPLDGEATAAGEFSTHLIEPGMVLRFEHGDPARRAGAYALGPFPVRQRRAADVLEFAQREMIRLTGLGDYVAQEKLGAIQVMGFDTNFPHGHADGPPHVHMHLRWPGNAGTQIGHYYLDARGLLTRNMVGLKSLDATKTLGPGETFTTTDPYGRPVYSHTITPEGWLKLGRAAAPPCLIKPVDDGFDSGAVVACPDQAPVTVKVEDDMAAGILRVWSNAVVETFRYDRDTGTLLSSQAAPLPLPSAYSGDQMLRATALR